MHNRDNSDLPVSPGDYVTSTLITNSIDSMLSMMFIIIIISSSSSSSINGV